jgi:hypothetical protein
VEVGEGGFELAEVGAGSFEIGGEADEAVAGGVLDGADIPREREGQSCVVRTRRRETSFWFVLRGLWIVAGWG